jgi:two-component system, cell cycle sensor histidine kinase PleC
MFNLLRYFSLTSAVVVVIATVAVITLYRHIAVDDIVESAETENAGLAQSFADQIWPAFESHFDSVDSTNLEALRSSVETTALQLSLESLTRGLPVLKVRIYTAEGYLAFSSTIEEIGRPKPELDQAISTALSGTVSSALLRRDDYVMPSGAPKDRYLVETHLPILGEDNTVQGIFELHTDVTDLMVGIRDTISGMVIAILLAFCALYGALFLIVRRADGIMKEQYQDLLSSRESIQARNNELQREITERIRVEKALISASEAAEAANKAKSEFLANMSHELRTPLNAVIGFSDTIVQEIFGPIRNKKYADYIRDIGNAGRHLLAIINDILDLSKIDAGEDDLDESDIEIGENISSCLTLVRNWADKADITLNAELPEERIEIRADARKFRQILLNLVSNAIKFTPAGGTVEIKAWSGEAGGCVVQVSDNGIGMAPADIPKALAIFGQVDSGLARQFEGTGLGLPLAKRFADLHGATLDIESSLGAGTTVTVRFGACIEPPRADEVPAQDNEPTASNSEEPAHDSEEPAQDNEAPAAARLAC